MQPCHSPRTGQKPRCLLAGPVQGPPFSAPPPRPPARTCVSTVCHCACLPQCLGHLLSRGRPTRRVLAVGELVTWGGGQTHGGQMCSVSAARTIIRVVREVLSGGGAGGVSTQSGQVGGGARHALLWSLCLPGQLQRLPAIYRRHRKPWSLASRPRVTPPAHTSPSCFHPRPRCCCLCCPWVPGRGRPRPPVSCRWKVLLSSVCSKWVSHEALPNSGVRTPWPSVQSKAFFIALEQPHPTGLLSVSV